MKCIQLKKDNSIIRVNEFAAETMVRNNMAKYINKKAWKEFSRPVKAEILIKKEKKIKVKKP